MEGAGRGVFRLAWGLLICTALLPAGEAAAQVRQPSPLAVATDSTTVQEILLRDGTTLIGRVVAIDGDRITIRTVGDLEIVVQRSDVVRVRDVRGVRYGDEFWPADPSDSRLFFAPTARVAAPGHGYFGVYELFFGSAGFGVGPRTMISGGFSLVPGAAIDEQVFYVAPKIQLLDTRPVQAAVGVFWAKAGFDDGSGGLAFGTVTAGSERAAATAGLGFPFFAGEGFTEDQVVLLGAEIRAARSVKLITENWFMTGANEGLLSGGVRLILSAVTIEIAGVTSTEGGFLLPLVNVSLVW